MQEDAILVQQTLTGDEQAFHRLIMKYYTAIYALIMSWIKNPEDARDLTQEVFLEAYQGLASLKQPEQFDFWLKKIAKHHCQDWFRKRREPYLELSEDIICDTPPIDELLILQETLTKVMKAIDELPETESQLLKERYLDEASYDDLKAKHGLSKSVLSMRLVRARQRVREKIKPLLSILTLPWHCAVKKIPIGGIEAMKVSAKVKVITIGIVSLLTLSGTGVILWRHHQSTQETPMISISQTEQQKNPLPVNRGRSTTKPTVKEDVGEQIERQENIKDTETIDRRVSPEEVTGQEAKGAEAKVEETPLQKYQRIWYSPEFRLEYENATAPHEADYQRLVREAKDLLQKKKNLESDLSKVSGEEKDKIQKELEKVETDYKEARIRACVSFSTMMAEGDCVILKYFSPEEFHEAIFQMAESQGMPTPPPLPTKEESEIYNEITFSPEEWAEAEKRLSARGINTRIIPPPSQALLDKYVLRKR